MVGGERKEGRGVHQCLQLPVCLREPPYRRHHHHHPLFFRGIQLSGSECASNTGTLWNIPSPFPTRGEKERERHTERERERERERDREHASNIHHCALTGGY